MIFSEPPPTPYDLKFSVLGVPVRVHPMFWLVSVLLGARGNEKPLTMVLWVVTVFVSIIVHELGHALTARSYGWEPHITLHGFGGLASYRPTYHSPASQILITLAGPGAGFLFAGLIVLILAATGHHPQFGWPEFVLPVIFDPFDQLALNVLVYYLLYVNIFWGLINLLPILPLDGGRIAQEVLMVLSPRDGLQMSLWLSIFVAVGAGVLAWTRLHDGFLAFFCGYLAYTSYTTLQAYTGRGGGWGGFR